MVTFFVSHDAHTAIYNSEDELIRSVDFALQPVFAPVGLLVGEVDGSLFGAGSGVLIDEQWVLFAAHELTDTTQVNTWDSLHFSTLPDTFGNFEQFTRFDLVIPFPDYVQGTPAGQGNDIALGRLSKPITNLTAATRFRDGADLIGLEALIAGYGRPGLFPNEGDFDGIRRGGRNIIDSFGRFFGVTVVDEQYLVSDFDFFSSQALDLEWQGSNVDSGCGWFVNVNGEYQLAGITNGGLLTSTSTFAIRVSLYNDWIDETIAANSIPKAGDIALVLGELIVEGTATRDEIRVTETGDVVNVNINDECHAEFPSEDVQMINIVSFGGADLIAVDAAIPTFISAGNGADTITGGTGENEILGGPGADTIYGGPVNDIINAGRGQDFVQARDGDDEIIGGDANDTLLGGPGNDIIFGGLGLDTLNGGSGDDELTGNIGSDHLIGGPGNDILTGHGGNDVLDGGSGDDQLQGGAGTDELNGGPGIDTALDVGETETGIEN